MCLISVPPVTEGQLIALLCNTVWRDDHRREANGEQFRLFVGLVAKNKPSVDFCGYWQRARAS
jgi:hypothetical protein